MKKIMMIAGFMVAGLGAFAQTDHKLYMFNQVGAAHEVHRYGTYPEFPFLRNLATKEQFVAAMHRGAGAAELNSILKGIGFRHGAKDVTTASVAAAHIPEGTIGNMGDAGHNYLYAKLYGDGGGVKAWKVTGDNGTVIYFISKCGNAFYADPNANGNVSAMVAEQYEGIDPMPVVEPARPVCKDKVYIYYGGVKKIHRGWEIYADDMDVECCNNPGDDGAMARAEDEPAKVYTDISVDKTSAYLGYKPEYSCKSDKENRQEEKEYTMKHKHSYRAYRRW